jgi:hypothetical protein
MPRDSDIATRVNRTPQDNTAAGVPLSVEAQPITEHNAIQGDRATEMADQLADSLGVATKVGGQIYAKQQAADTSQAETDAALGNVAPPNPSVAYAASQDHVHALASWAVDGDAIGTKAQQMGFDQNPDAKQGLADMNNWLSEQFKGQYDGSSDSTMNTLKPKMAELRNNLNSWFTQSQASQVLAKNQADIKTIAGSAFAKSFTLTDPNNPQFGGSFDASKFDYAGINANTQSVMPGKIGNLTFLDTLVSMARDKGVPSLLTSMPDRWADGTPTPKGSGDPAVQKMYDAAVREAGEQQKMNLAGADKFNKDANKAYIKSSETSIMDNILSGRDQTAALHAYARNADADPAFLEKAANWQHERFKQGADEAADGSAVASIQHDIGMGTLTSTSQLVARLDAANIPAQARTSAFTKLAGNLKEVQSTQLDDPATKMYLQHLENVYKPTTDAAGKFDHPAAAQQQADLLLDFRRQAMQPNADPKTIFDAVQKKYGPPIDADKTITRLPLTPTDTDRAKLITTRDGGTFNAAGFNASGMTMQDVKRLRGNGQISDADAAEAAKAVLARHNQ